MSAKSVAEKLRIEPGTRLWSSHPERIAQLEPLPEGVRVVDDVGDAEAGVVYGDDAAAVKKLVGALGTGLLGLRLLWVAYPKGNRSDINRDSVWPILAEPGEEFKGGGS